MNYRYTKAVQRFLNTESLFVRIAQGQYSKKQKQDEIGEFRIEIQEKLGQWLEENFPHGVRSDRKNSTVNGTVNSTMPVSSNKSSRGFIQLDKKR